MAEVETQPSTSFFHSLREALSFSRNKKDDVPRVQLETFIEEKERVDEIERLFEEGRQQDALRELIKDTNVDNPLSYYNQILSSEKISYPTEHRSKRNEKCRDDESKTCEWTGYNRKYNTLWCSNKILHHPWKTIENVFGQEESVKSKHCVYHQKYCSDSKNRHEGRMVKITIPNDKALCTECHIISEGVQPKQLIRYPGLRRKDTPQHNVQESNIQESNNLTKCDVINGSKKEVTPHFIVNVKRKSNIIPKAVLSTVLAISKIQRRWRKSRNILRKASEMERYKYSRIQNKAALKIQACFRSHSLVTKRRNGYSLQSSCDIDNEEASSPQRECAPESERYDIRMKQIEAESNHPQTLPLCLPCLHPDLQEEKFVLNSEPPKGMKSEKRQHRLCELPACQVCHKTRINTAKGRDKELTSPLGTKARSDMLRETSFRSIDRFDLGSLPRKDFFQVVRSYYEKKGQPLLPEEARALINAFECRDGRDGHIDYVKFMAFAKNQIHPCLIHSRLICATCTTRSRYKANAQCKKYEPDPSQPAFCRCGKYKSRHEQLPIIEAIQETRRRGFRMFADQDLQRTFDRQIKADTGLRSEIEFQSIKSATYRPDDAYIPPPPKKTRDNNTLLTGKNIAKGPHKFIKEPIESPVLSPCDDLIVNSSPESMTILRPSKRSIQFSANRLELMMDKCVEYRMYSVEPKPSIRCPLCKISFYEKSMLQNHLKNRHSTEEIQYHIQDLQPITINPSVRVQVKWEGKYTIVPPLPSPVPLDLCYHHVPPHPKCRTCKETLKHCKLFPPIRFYPGAFVEVGRHDDGTGGAVPAQEVDNISTATVSYSGDAAAAEFRKLKKNYHFTLADSDLAVIVTMNDDTNCDKENAGDCLTPQMLLGKLVAVCEDGRKKKFLGLRFYHSFLGHSKNEGKKSSLLPPTDDLHMNSKKKRHVDELVMETKISWVEMKNVIGRKHVFHCTKRQFQKKKVEMNVCADNTIHFCQYELKEGDLSVLL